MSRITRGSRVRLTREGLEWWGTREQIAAGTLPTGVVVGFGRDVPGVRVRIDGRRRGELFPLSCVEPADSVGEFA